NAVSAAALAGIAVSNFLTTITNPVTAGLTITANIVTSAGGAGIYLLQAIDSATVSQRLAIDSNTVTTAGGNGIASRLGVGAAGSVPQTGTVNANLVPHAAGNGVFFSAAADGTAGLNLSLSGNTISSNGGNGFAGRADGAGVTEVFTLVS